MPSAVIVQNVFVSGLVFGGNSGEVIDLWVEGHFVLVTSARLLDQLELLLSRPKFSKYWPNHRGHRMLIALRAGVLTTDVSLDLRLCRDPDDDELLNLAAGAGCDYLVTGDFDLLDDDELKRVMREQHGVKVITLNEFLAVLQAQ